VTLSVSPSELRWIQTQLETQHNELRRIALVLADDDYDGTEDTRARIGEAREALASAAGLVEQAHEQLPQDAELTEREWSVRHDA
jgi:hypothetical protein